MGSVVLDHVNKSFGGVDVIRDVSIAIPDGEFCVLVGPSGSGKSTLLRIIAGLEEVTSGRVHINGRDVTEEEPKARDIAMVFQSYALYPQMTVAENMGFALKLARVDKAKVAAKVDEVARMLGLEALLDRLPKQLSGGQRQRVAMGRAIVRDPAVFLFDEPLSNLDAKLRTQVRGEIRDLHKRLGTTSVYVTHDQIEAMTMGQTIVVLRDGRVEQAGAPLDLYDRPANLFVAGFIGSPAINQMDAVIAEDGHPAARLGDGALIALPGGLAVRPGAKVRCAIRPEHLRIVAAGTPAALPARVAAVENTGSDMLLFCDTGGGRLTLAFKDRLPIAEGDQLALQPLADKVHVFDADSGRRITAA
jgi:multiple sugar transport system ATP-binding protein